MAPGTIQNDANAANGNNTALKPTARSFHPTGTPDPAKYHASSSNEAIQTEAAFAAHNYHPLPIGLSRLLFLGGDAVLTGLSVCKSEWMQCMGSRGQALSRLPLRLQCRQPGPLPPRARQGLDRASIAVDAQQSRLLQ